MSVTRIRHVYRKSTPGQGNIVENGRRCIAVRFEVETFEEIRKRALDHRTGVAEQIRFLVEDSLKRKPRSRAYQPRQAGGLS